jgi:glycosyltransferase involved in cell wall biosynthesis
MKNRNLSILMWGRAKSNPASRFRLIQFIKPLEEAGYKVSYVTTFPEANWRCKWKVSKFLFWALVYIARLSMLISSFWHIFKAGFYDIVIVNRDLLPFLKTPWLMKMLVTVNSRMIFDFDDAIYLNSPATKIGSICKMAKYVMVGNNYLADFARMYNDKVEIMPTVIDTNYIIPEKEPSSNNFKIGWIGSDDSYEYSFSKEIKAAVREFALNYGAEVIISKETPPPEDDWKDIMLTFKKWSFENEKAVLRHVDVGIMPVIDDYFQRGKCGGKLTLYMAAGLPVIASPVGVNCEIIENGLNGFLADSAEEWQNALKMLCEDSVMRLKMGNECRKIVVERYSVNYAFSILNNIIRKTVNG